MLSISVVQGDGTYYGVGDEPGRGFGDAKMLLGLPTTADQVVFKRLLAGLAPDGMKRLVPPHPRRDKGWDLTFSAPKSVSVLWALGDDTLRRKIEQCHDGAVAVALKFMESQAGMTRRGQGGKLREPAALLFMLRKHRISRAGDPGLHTHAVAANLAVRADGTCGAVHSHYFYRAKMMTGAVYQVEFARRLNLTIGLELIPGRVGFHVRGVPKNLCRTLSKRRIEIKKYMNSRGTHRAVDAQRAALSTRPKKVAVKPADLRKAWMDQAAEYRWGPEQAQALVMRSGFSTSDHLGFKKALAEVIAHIPVKKRTSHSTVREATRLAMKFSIGGTHLLRAMVDVPFFREPLHHIRWVRLFPKAPWWSPVHNLKVPQLVVGGRPRRWGKVLWKKPSGPLELRVQMRRLFPRMPNWHFAAKITLPALRITKPERRHEQNPQHER